MKINRLKNKLWVKFLAAVLLFIFGIGCIAGAAGVYLCDSYRVYYCTQDTLRTDMNEQMLTKYAVQALAVYTGHSSRELSPNYHYAIYEGSTEEGRKVAGDLDGSLPKDAVVHEFSVTDDTTYLLADSMFGEAYVQSGYEHNTIEDQIQQIYYSVDTHEDREDAAVDESGPKQAKAESQPVPADAATDTKATTDANAATDINAATDSTDTVDANAATDAEDTADASAATDETVSSDTIDAAAENSIELYVTGCNNPGSIMYRVSPDLYRIDEKRGMIWLKRNIGGELGVPASKMQEMTMETSDLALSPYEVNRFYFDDSYGGDIEQGWFRAGEKEEGTVYTVAGVVDKDLALTGSWTTADFFEQTQILLGWLYRIRYAAWVLILVGFLGGIALFIFLLSAAGHRESESGDADVIRIRFIDRIPMDLALILTFMFCAMCALPVLKVLRIWDPRLRTTQAVCTSLLCMAAAYAVALEFCMSLAVNIKVGGWWERTLICRLLQLLKRVCGWIGRIIVKIYRNFRESASGVAMGKRIWALFVLFAVFEFIGIIVLRYSTLSLLFCWLAEKLIFFFVLMKILQEFGKIKEAGAEIAGGNLDYKLETQRMFIDLADVGNSLNTIGDGLAGAVDERMKSERMKTELITNVSHDIKTPLTSIINYTDLLTKLDLQDPTAGEYLEVLGRQSARLKKLIEDLIEASKASSGVLKLEMETVNASMLLMQAVGEYGEKFSGKGLDLRVTGESSEMKVRADSRYLWRVFDNLMSNMMKYAQAGTRAYIDMAASEGGVSIIFRNISETPLHISGDELMERFVRGDSSRSTEGSGLGLSIADSLVTLMGGKMEIIVDGDLFKVVVRMPSA